MGLHYIGIIQDTTTNSTKLPVHQVLRQLFMLVREGGVIKKSRQVTSAFAGTPVTRLSVSEGEAKAVTTIMMLRWASQSVEQLYAHCQDSVDNNFVGILSFSLTAPTESD